MKNTFHRLIAGLIAASVLLCGYVHAQTRRYADAHAHTYADISGEARARAMRNPHRRASGPAPRGRR